MSPTKELVTKYQCEIQTKKCYENNIKPIMDEIKSLVQTVNDFKIEVVKEIASMPERILEKTDGKYASKDLEVTVADMSKLQNQRTYDWLKYAIITVIGIAVTILVIQPATNTKQETEDKIQAAIDKAIKQGMVTKDK